MRARSASRKSLCEDEAGVGARGAGISGATATAGGAAATAGGAAATAGGAAMTGAGGAISSTGDPKVTTGSSASKSSCGDTARGGGSSSGGGGSSASAVGSSASGGAGAMTAGADGTGVIAGAGPLPGTLNLASNPSSAACRASDIIRPAALSDRSNSDYEQRAAPRSIPRKPVALGFVMRERSVSLRLRRDLVAPLAQHSDDQRNRCRNGYYYCL